MDALELAHWWHKALLEFGSLSHEEQKFFSLRPNEPMLWLTPNAKRSLYVRFMKARSRQSDMQALLAKDPRTFLPALAKSYQHATTEELRGILDTSHRRKFPLSEAKHKW